MVPRLGNANPAVGSHRRSALLCTARKQYIGPGNPSAGKTRCARPHEVLVAEIARSATAQSAEDTDFNYDGGSFLPCSLRSLHGEIPRAGWCSFHMDQAGGYWYSGYRQHIDAGKEKSGNRCRISNVLLKYLTNA